MTIVDPFVSFVHYSRILASALLPHVSRMCEAVLVPLEVQMLILARSLKRRALVATPVILLFSLFVDVAVGYEPRFVSLEGRFAISLPDRSSSRKLSIPTPSGNAYGDLHEWRKKRRDIRCWL